MISLRQPATAAQASLEALLGLTAMVLISIAGAALLLHGMGNLIAVRWAAKTSLCIAMKTPPPSCLRETREQLQSHFAFRDVWVGFKEKAKIIHTEIRARLIDRVLISVSYDLGPSEYKRVSK